MKGRAAQPSHEDKLRLDGVAADVAADAAAKIMAKVPTKTREEEVTDKAAHLVNIVMERYTTMRQLDLHPTSRKQALEDIYKMLREEMRTWPQDDLLIEASFMIALTVVNELYGKLI